MDCEPGREVAERWHQFGVETGDQREDPPQGETIVEEAGDVPGRQKLGDLPMRRREPPRSDTYEQACSDDLPRSVIGLSADIREGGVVLVGLRPVGERVPRHAGKELRGAQPSGRLDQLARICARRVRRQMLTVRLPNEHPAGLVKRLLAGIRPLASRDGLGKQVEVLGVCQQRVQPALPRSLDEAVGVLHTVVLREYRLDVLFW